MPDDLEKVTMIKRAHEQTMDYIYNVVPHEDTKEEKEEEICPEFEELVQLARKGEI